VLESYSEIEFSDFERIDNSNNPDYQWIPKVPVTMDKFFEGVTFKMKQNIELVGNVKYVNNMAYIYITVKHMLAQPYSGDKKRV
jgi:hypothetical protein